MAPPTALADQVLLPAPPAGPALEPDRRQDAPGLCGPALLAGLAAHGTRTAVLTPDAEVSYADLAVRVGDAARRLGATRRLVLVAGANALDVLVAYLGALAGGHPVLLAPPAALDALREVYDPDVVVGPDGDLRERRAGTAHDLHPDLALLLTTSGSTGSPKLVRLSHANLESNARSIVQYLGLGPADRAVTTLPLHYCYGLSVVHSHLLAGAGLVLTDLSVAAPCFWDLVARTRATGLAGVPYTFDLLDRVGFAEMHLPHLRRVTQAGGRLAPDRVRAYAALGRRKGFDLVVMYGQTEATARMAYLPPHLAEQEPGAIGVPVPGGSFRLDPVEGRDDAGELVYRGPNVMMGYARRAADLALGATVTELRTGDLARRTPRGLYEVVGRRSRVAKVFGLRIDLDHLERTLADQGCRAWCLDGGTELLLAVDGDRDAAAARRCAAGACGLPPRAVRAVALPELPRLPSGKPDHAAVLRAATTGSREPVAPPAGASRLAALRRVYADVLERPDVRDADSFVGLGGDSLSFVEASLRLEEVLGRLPRDWHLRSLSDLAALPLADAREVPAAGTDASRPAPSRSGTRSVDAGLVLRAVAVLLVVASHADVVDLRGGAHLLLAVAGYNVARFHLTPAPRRARLRSALRSARRVVVPSVLWIAAVMALGGAYEPVNLVLLNGLLGPERLGPTWEFWFLEVLVHALLLTALLLAVPAVDRAERRWPLALPLVLLALALVARTVVRLEPGADRVYSLPATAWLFVLGWAAARCLRARERLLVSALAAATVPGFFADAERAAVLLVGFLVLVWVPAVRLPDLLARAAAVLAAASLYVYLTHWQVFPHLERDAPLLAVAASVAVGLAYRAGYERLAASARGALAAAGVGGAGRRPSGSPCDRSAAMTAPESPTEDTPTAATDGRSGKQHGDPLLDSAQGRGDGSDASRHGADADGTDAPAR